MAIHISRSTRLVTAAVGMVAAIPLLAGCHMSSGTPSPAMTGGTMTESTMTGGATMSASPDAMMSASPDTMMSSSPDTMMSQTPDAMMSQTPTP